MVKTEFGKASLKPVNPPVRVYPDNETTLTFVSNSTDLTNATLNYTNNNWGNSSALNMQLTDNRTCTGNVPGQPAGTTVRYRVKAADVFENVLVYNGSYTVKYASTLNMTLKTETISIGENITLTGLVTPPAGNLTVTLIFTSPNGTIQQTAYTRDNGTFATSFRPEMQGNWLVQANFKGDNQLYESTSQSLRFKVNPPPFLRQYATYIYAGAGAGVGTAVLAFVYIRKRRT